MTILYYLPLWNRTNTGESSTLILSSRRIGDVWEVYIGSVGQVNVKANEINTTVYDKNGNSVSVDVSIYNATGIKKDDQIEQVQGGWYFRFAFNSNYDQFKVFDASGKNIGECQLRE